VLQVPHHRKRFYLSQFRSKKIFNTKLREQDINHLFRQAKLSRQKVEVEMQIQKNTNNETNVF
jgi:site-specific DNA-cytosine methylase